MRADFRVLHNLHTVCLQQFTYAADMLAFGSAEHWVSPDEISAQLARNGFVLGDCDDFASLAVMLARQQGMPARFVLCLTETGEMHLVAEVDGWVLDNRQADVVRRDDLAYSWLAISGFAPGDPWREVVSGGHGNA